VKTTVLVTVFLLTLRPAAYSQEGDKARAMQDCPMPTDHASEGSHHASVESHGDQAMGFSHNTTIHHFRMFLNGGAVEVTANDPVTEPPRQQPVLTSRVLRSCSGTAISLRHSSYMMVLHLL
jgi:hypothetical protein